MKVINKRFCINQNAYKYRDLFTEHSLYFP